MSGSLINSERTEPQRQATTLNQNAQKCFTELFYSSERANEKQAQTYWSEVEKIGFSPLFHKDWHFSPLGKILNVHYQLNNAIVPAITAEQLKQLAIGINSWKIVFFNGRLMPTLSSDHFGPYKIQMMDSLAQLPEPIINDEIFLYLTESLAAQPLLIKLAANHQVESPLYILNITSGAERSECVNMSYYRYHVDIGVNCQSHIIEHFISMDDTPHLTGSRLTANIGNNSHFNHIKLSAENNLSNHFAYNDILSGYNTQIKSSCIFIGSALLCHNTSVKLNGSCSNLTLNSLSIPHDSEIVDNRTYIEHNHPYCGSRQLHKTIALDESKAIFTGMVKVLPVSVKTDSKITHNSLLLGKYAETHTKPQLEIYADDVKCSHGATVGFINDEQLFYLCSRGIPIDNAKHMIIIAFAVEIIKAIDDEVVSNKIMNIIQQRLTGT
ncbi:MAG: Fe-S cluster assembly protein SufD [Candidatus Arsenophonus melophagi]|nr:Fe-S cluster assembly protein SufD [Candidatus Arsenophonus melophagi]